MNEYCYELSLPALEDILIDPTYYQSGKYYDVEQYHNILIELNISNILKPEWLNFLELPWSTLIYFMKSEHEGPIHTDYNNDQCRWAINWILNDSCVMKYWETTHVQKVNRQKAPIYNLNNKKTTYLPIFTSTIPPDREYTLKKGKSYLVNISTPHAAWGGTNKKTISYRVDPNLHNMNWNQIVTLFNKHITPY